MKKLALLALLAIGGFTANAQSKPATKPAAQKSCCAKGGSACCKTKAAAKATKPACCKNEKAMSALRRPIAKPLTASNKTK